MKAVRIFLVILAMAGIIACKTTKRVNDNEVLSVSEIIVYDSTSGYGIFEIYIDNELRGKIEREGKTNFIVSNGRHKIYAVWKYGDIISISEKTDELLFNTHGDQNIFQVSHTGILFTKTAIKLKEIKPLALADDSSAAKIAAALNKSFNNFSKNIPKKSKIAILTIYSNDNNEEDFIVNTLTSLFVNSNNYFIVERSNIDVIKQEQKFQMSGDFDEDNARSIGKLIGAEIVIIGNIKTFETIRQLNIKALHIETGQILSMLSENL